MGRGLPPLWDVGPRNIPGLSGRAIARVRSGSGRPGSSSLPQAPGCGRVVEDKRGQSKSIEWGFFFWVGFYKKEVKCECF